MKENRNFSKPDFICIGPHKTGTSWLNSTLGVHQEIQKSVIKELSYFSNYERNQKGLIASTRNKGSHLKKNIRRKSFSKNIKKYYKFRDNKKRRKQILKKINYEFRQVLGLYSFDFYSSFFQQCEGKKTGDISPEYFALQKETILRIKTLYPNVKIIIFLREPVSRIWSHIKMNIVNYKIPINENSLKKMSNSVLVNDEKGLYPLDGLKNWLNVFESEQIFIGYHDELKSEPVLFYKKICRFLSISDKIEKDVLFMNKKRKKEIASKEEFVHFKSAEELISYQYNFRKLDLEMPPDLKNSLSEYYYPKVKELNELLKSPYPEKWLSDYKKK